MDIKDIELEKVYEFRPKAVIDPCGIREIKRQIKENWNVSNDFSEDFDWSGNLLAKRIIVDLGIAYGDVGPSGMGWLGGLCGSLLLPEVDMRFRFSNNFGWNNGEYGDRGSCMFQEGYKGPKVLQHNKAWAVQFLNKAGKGIGRCLMATDGEVHVLFNAYGLMYDDDVMAKSVSSTASRQDNKVSFVAALFQQFFGLDYKRVQFSINGNQRDPVYINGEMGYLLGPWKEIRLSRSVDFSMDADIFPKCKKCGNYVDKDKLTKVDAALYGGYTALCNECKADYETHCFTCGTLLMKRDKNLIHADDGMDFCSLAHISEVNYRKCGHCGSWEYSGGLIWDDTGKQWLCGDCVDRYYRTCQFCYKLIRKVDFTRYEKPLPVGHPALIYGCKECVSNLKLYGSAKGPANAEADAPRKRKVKV